ncbi:MAG: O-antigen ligase family protein [Flavobacteriales bacterium]
MGEVQRTKSILRLTPPLLILLGSSIGLLMGMAFYLDWLFLLSLPVILAVLYVAVYHTGLLFQAVVFFTPLSINIEEYTSQFGLFIPTEPLLFGLMLLLIFYELKSNLIAHQFIKQPLVLILIAYLSWLIICSITSTHPLISFKSILSRLWFIIPVFFFGPLLLSKEKALSNFFWLLTIGTTLVILYTILNHASYGFGEKESHWVMSPFYKDHTIYGAAVALVVPFPIMLFLLKKQSPLRAFVLGGLFLIIMLGLFFSYTRAAWLSVFGAMIVLSLVLFKVRFNLLLIVAGVALITLIWNRDTIQMELARNKTEHTTEAFDERIQSAANVTTDASNLERINRWSCALEMFKERPVFGFGPATYSFEYARFQEPENLTIISTNFGDMGNAHSEYLSALSETGLIGFSLFIAFVISVFYYLIVFIQRARSINRAYFIMGCGILFSLTTYFIHAFLNNFLDTDKAAVPVYGMIAILFVLNNRLSAEPDGRI